MGESFSRHFFTIFFAACVGIILFSEQRYIPLRLRIAEATNGIINLAAWYFALTVSDRQALFFQFLKVNEILILMLLAVRMVVIFITCLCAGCSTNTDKSNVEALNKDRFDTRSEKKDAQFVVDAIDDCYGILEVAQLGEERSSDILQRGKAKEIVEGQTSIVIKLKTFAEENDISIPFSGPERTKGSVKRLYDKEGPDFDNAWKEEMETLTEKLKQNFENYRGRADDSLKHILNSSIAILREHQDLMTEAQTGNLN